MEDDNSLQNTCVICLEDMGSGNCVVGAAVPCGHCFHQDCFERWRASAAARSRCYYDPPPEVKCPTCNKLARSFCRIYLDLAGPAGAANGNDFDDSLSTDDDEEPESDNVENEGTDEPDDSTDSPNLENAVAAVEVIEIGSDDDHVGSPPPPPAQSLHATLRTSSAATSCSSSNHKKYKARAKFLKRRVSVLERERTQQAQELKGLLDCYDAKRGELEKSQAELDALKTEREALVLERQGTSLELVQLRREKRELSSALERTTADKENAEKRLNEVRKEHARELHKVRAKNMTEVRHILADHPKLIQENRQLKEVLERAKKQIHQLKKLVPEQAADASKQSRIASASRPALPGNPYHRTKLTSRDAFKAVHQLSQLHAHQAAHPLPKDKDREYKASSKAELHGKLSAHAMRFSKPEKKVSNSIGLKLLEQHDGENSEAPSNSKRPAQQQTKLPFLTKRPRPYGGNLAIAKGRIT